MPPEPKKFIIRRKILEGATRDEAAAAAKCHQSYVTSVFNRYRWPPREYVNKKPLPVPSEKHHLYDFSCPPPSWYRHAQYFPAQQFSSNPQPTQSRVEIVHQVEGVVPRSQDTLHKRVSYRNRNASFQFIFRWSATSGALGTGTVSSLLG